jgi:cholesterol transport system auxiliary component
MSRVSLLAAGLCLLLGGCAALGGPKTEVKVYSPAAKITADPSWPAADWSLSVGVQAANQLIDSARIAVRPEPHRLQAYKDAAWADTAPDLLETTLVEGFEDSGKILAVGRLGSTARGDFGLFLELRAFETVYTDGRPEAVIEAQVLLIRFRGDRGVVASKRFRQVVPGSAPELDAMVASFGQALSTMGTEVVGWALVEGDKAVKAAAEKSAAE